MDANSMFYFCFPKIMQLRLPAGIILQVIGHAF